MAEKRDYYEVIGVTRDVSAEELKKAYRRKARELHPDVNRDNPHAEEHFKELGEAYDVLSDPQKRAVYDRFGHAGMQGAAGGGYGGGGYGAETIFGDIFENFFGGGMGGNRQDPRGADLRYDMQITLEEAASGVERTIHYPHMVACATCRGVGSAAGAPVKCPACAGTGQRRQTSNSFFGMQFATVAPCDRCSATGEIITDPCKTCGGDGRVRMQEELAVRIPPGVDTGSRIRHRGKGDMGLRGAQQGDLIVLIAVKAHPVFQRRGSDLLCQAELPITIAALGGKLRVPTLDNANGAEVDIAAGTQTGYTARLRGRGLPNLDNGTIGDQYVVVNVKVPTDLSARQKELLRELAQERGEEVNVHKGLFQKMKEVVEDVVEDLRGSTKESAP